MEATCLVVGAGPVGLTMAALLNHYGVGCRIVDRLPEPALQTKAAGLWSRSLEVFEQLELADLLLSRSHRATRGNIFAQGRRVLELDLSKVESRYNFLTLIPQHRTEALLTEHLAKRGIQIERGTELTFWDGTLAGLKGPHGKEEFRPRYLFGCDGARSRVRREMGISFSGRTVEGHWLVGDLAARGGPLIDDEVCIFMSDQGPLAFFALGQGRYRCVALPGEEKHEEPTLERFQQIAAVRAPGLQLSELENGGLFSIHERQVEQYRSGSTFLLGDAAHVHSPAGGQGLNTGIQDAFNLAWKIAQVIHWKAPDALLESYHLERYPVAARVILGSSMATRMATAHNPVARAVRRAAMGAASHLEPVLDKVSETLSELNIHYHQSPLNGGRRWGRLRAGDRLPEVAWQENGEEFRLHSYLDGMNWTLLAFERSLDLGPRVSQFQVGHVKKVREACGVDEAGFLLVRPDGYLAGFFKEPPEVYHHLAGYVK